MSAAKDPGGGSKLTPPAAHSEKKEGSKPPSVSTKMSDPPSSLADIRGRRNAEDGDVYTYASDKTDTEQPRLGIHRTDLERGQAPSLSDPASIKPMAKDQAAAVVRNRAKPVERTAKLDEEIPRLIAMKESMQKNFFRNSDSAQDLDDTLVGQHDKNLNQEVLFQDAHSFHQDARSCREDDDLEHTLGGQENASDLLKDVEPLPWQDDVFDDIVEASQPEFLTPIGNLDETKDLPLQRNEPVEDDKTDLLQAAVPDEVPPELAAYLASHQPQEPPSDPLEETVNISHDELQVPVMLDLSDIPDEVEFPDILDIGEVVQDEDELNDTVILFATKK